MINHPQTLADIISNDREHFNARVEAMNEGRPFSQFLNHAERLRLREEYEHLSSCYECGRQPDDCTCIPLGYGN